MPARADTKARQKLIARLGRQIRDIRAKIDPDVLELTFQAIMGASPCGAQSGSVQARSNPLTDKSEMVAIDRKKMLNIAMAYLERNPDNPDLRRDLALYLKSREQI